MTMLSSYPLKENLDLPVIRVIAWNGHAETALCRDCLRDFIDRSGSGVRSASRRSPSNINSRAQLSEQGGNALTDTAARSRYDCDSTGQGRKPTHDSDLQSLG